VSTDVTILLARAANLDASGQVNALGLGWEIIGPSPLPGFVVIVKATRPEGQPGKRFNVRLQLLDSEGNIVASGQQDAMEPLDVRFEGEIPGPSAIPAGLKGAGTAVVLEMGPGLLLEPGIYEWVVSVDGETQPHWRAPFYVRAKPDEFSPQGRIATYHAPGPDA
jgi:hypothetical protein